MDFIEFLDKTEVEIIKMIKIAGYKTEENTKLCLLSENYVGFLVRRKKEVIICTSNAKKREGYTSLKKNNKESYIWKYNTLQSGRKMQTLYLMK